MRRSLAWTFSALACAAALGTPLFAASLHAQADWGVSFAAGGAAQITQSRIGTTRERLSGIVGGGEALATRHRFVARLRYAQGSVTNDTAERVVVEGEALLGYKARPWLTLWVGPHARTFLVNGLSDRRWLFWSGRVTARGAIFPGRLESFVEVWQGFSGRLSRPAEPATGRGTEAGLDVRFPPRPFWGRLAYRIEQGRADTGRRETVEAFSITVGYDLMR